MPQANVRVTNAGNFYINSGQFDESTFNPNSGYTKNLLVNSNFVGGTSGLWGSGATNPAGYVGNGNGGGISFATALSGNGISCRFYCTNARPYLNQYNYYPILPGVTYTFSVTIESITTSCGVASLFYPTGVANGSFAYYLNGVLVTGSIYLTQIVTGNYQVVFTSPSYYAANTILWRIGPGVSGPETADCVLANPQIEIGTTSSDYVPTSTTNTLPSMPTGFTTRTVKSGFYTVGSLDEATINTSSGYTKNLAAYSQTGSQWRIGSASGSIISTTELAPDGTYTAVRFRPAAQFAGVQTSNACWLPNIPLIGSAWVRVESGTRALVFSLNGGGLNTNFTATSTWQRFSSTSYSKPVTYSDYFTVSDPNSTGFVDFIVWGLQVEKGTVITDYEPTGAAAVPLLPTGLTTKTTSGGNNYIAGEYDEVTYNPLSGYKRNLFPNTENVVVNIGQGWSQTGGTSKLNPIYGVQGPDGTNNGIKLVEDPAYPDHSIQTLAFIKVPAGQPVTLSIYLKAAERSFVQLQADDIGVVPGAQFNLQTGVIVASYGGAFARIQAVGNGWYRCGFTATPVISNNINMKIILSKNATFTDYAYLGDSNSGIYIYGPQCELGPNLTTYVATGVNAVPLT